VEAAEVVYDLFSERVREGEGEREQNPYFEH
jgi:hypothetical protein